MAHFYTAERLPKFLPEIETPAQAVKDKKAWPSVTTVLSIIRDEFIDSIFSPNSWSHLHVSIQIWTGETSRI